MPRKRKVAEETRVKAQWNRDAGEFEVLTAGTTRTQVRQGLRMARKEVAPDLLILPVPAPETVR